MTQLLSKNKKMAKSANDLYTLYNFGIPAHKSYVQGIVTCPFAGQCAKENGCYAKNVPYTWSNVAQAYENRLAATQTSNFIELISKELLPKLKTAIRQGKQLVIRIHDSGDFYSVQYLDKWLKIIQAFPMVQFYAYTKSVPMFKRKFKNTQPPENFTIIFSEGGIADHLIDCQKDRHSRVFSSKEALISAGYDDASKDDTVAFKSLTGKIGLIYHGPTAKAWTTDQ